MKILKKNYNNIQKYNPKIIIIFLIDCSQFNLNKHNFFKNNFPSIKIYYYLLDNHSFNINDNLYNIIIPYKNNLFVNSYPNKNILNFKSRYFDKNIFKDYKLEKKYDILIYGSRSKNSFPKEKLQNNLNFRKYLKEYQNYFKKNKQNDFYFYDLRKKLCSILLKYKNKYNLKILDETMVHKALYQGKELSKLINQSYLTVCCSSIYDLLFYKHLEIPASNSVILGDYPSDYEETFKNNIIKIDKFMREEEIINIIDEALSDKKSLLEKSQKLHDIIHKEHCLENSIEDFKNIINKINNNK